MVIITLVCFKFSISNYDLEHDTSGVYVIAAVFVFIALILSAYTSPSNPFNYVLSGAPSSIVQEHVADLSQALCHVIPGLSRLLLPRINSLVLLAFSGGFFTLLTYYLIGQYEWIDAINAVLLAFVVFTTLMPLSIHSGRILLQVT
jgi:zinc transporter 6